VNCIGGKYVFAICQGVRLSGRATINFPLERQIDLNGNGLQWDTLRHSRKFINESFPTGDAILGRLKLMGV